MELKPCPFCGGRAEFDEITDMDHPEFGGHFVSCLSCLACVGLKYASKDDPRPELAEQWNRRLEPSSLVDDEDERGFTPSDYAHTAKLLRSTETIRKATTSNNHNIILAALDRCATAPADATEEQGFCGNPQKEHLSSPHPEDGETAAALKPFANLCDPDAFTTWSDDTTIFEFGTRKITLGDIRRARALSKQSEG